MPAGHPAFRRRPGLTPEGRLTEGRHRKVSRWKPPPPIGSGASVHESAGWRVRGRPAARPLGIAAPLPTVTARPVAGRGGRVLPGRPPPANATPPSGERAGDVAEVLPHGHLSLAPRRGRPLVRVAAFTVRDFSREINAQYGQVTLSVDLGGRIRRRTASPAARGGVSGHGGGAHPRGAWGRRRCRRAGWVRQAAAVVAGRRRGVGAGPWARPRCPPGPAGGRSEAGDGSARSRTLRGTPRRRSRTAGRMRPSRGASRCTRRPRPRRCRRSGR